ncbi:SH2 domain-containing protein 6 isoform X2 [Lepidochelys kempii]|uniref:SH2 domain-containing protein 6 isoform X2 n=1 Tax=Lepidochelys kempii TaxID=8472 RepID=UPI003C70083E
MGGRGLRPHPRPPSGRGPSVAEESEEGDTYEAPPCESQAWKVAPAKRQEDTDGTYLDHATARRCSEPFTQLRATFLSKLSLVPGTDAGNREEMPRGLACGKGLDRTRAKLPPAPTSRKVSLSGSLPRPLPTPAGPTAPRASSKAPAWPRGSRSPAEDPGMQDQAWYAGSCDRHMAESVLQAVNKRVHGAPELGAGLESTIHLGRAVQGPRLQHPHPLPGEQPPVHAGQGREEPRGALRQRGQHRPALQRAPPGADRGQLRLQGAHLPALPRQALRAGPGCCHPQLCHAGCEALCPGCCRTDSRGRQRCRMPPCGAMQPLQGTGLGGLGAPRSGWADSCFRLYSPGGVRLL